MEFDFIMLVTGLIHERLNSAVRLMKKSSLSTYDILIKAGHMRMVMQKNEWRLHNTRTKDLELLKAMGFTPATTYPPCLNGVKIILICTETSMIVSILGVGLQHRILVCSSYHKKESTIVRYFLS